MVKTCDTNFKMNPPLRTQDDIDAIIVGLTDGTLDCIASDHAPHSIEEKEEEFQYAPNGILGLETEIGLTFSELFYKKILDLKDIVEKLSINPRRILNIPIPKFDVGQEANFTILDTDVVWTVDVNKFKSKSKNSPFDKKLLTGRSVAVINNRKMFYNDEFSHTPTKDEMIGKWEGMLVSDSFVSSRSQIFDFDYDGSGEYQMYYNFSNLIRGFSEVSTNNNMFRFDDFTPFHDELRMIRPDFVVGKWVTDWSLLQSNRFSIQELQNLINSGASTIQILDGIYKIFNLRLPRLPQEIGISFLNVENHPQKGSRIGLSYILRRMN